MIDPICARDPFSYMRTPDEVRLLLDDLDVVPADELEDQDLDFKEWIMRSRNDALNQVVEYAVCMANGGGGTVVFGVRDRVIGRGQAILGVPLEIDINLLKKVVYDSTTRNSRPSLRNSGCLKEPAVSS
jgi:ATP-dependent DNA helicase RecG